MVFQSCVSATLCKFHLDGALPCPQCYQRHAFHRGGSNPLTPWWFWQGWAGQCPSNLYLQRGCATRYLLWGVVSLMCLSKELTPTCIYTCTHTREHTLHLHTYIHTRTYIVHTHTAYTHTCMHTHAYTHAHTQAHTHTVHTTHIHKNAVFLSKQMFFCVVGFFLLCSHTHTSGPSFSLGDMLCSSSMVLRVTDQALQWVWACL
jgi:hypothetical protein